MHFKSIYKPKKVFTSYCLPMKTYVNKQDTQVIILIFTLNSPIHHSKTISQYIRHFLPPSSFKLK